MCVYYDFKEIELNVNSCNTRKSWDWYAIVLYSTIGKNSELGSALLDLDSCSGKS